MTERSVLRTTNGGTLWSDVTPAGYLYYNTASTFLDADQAWLAEPQHNRTVAILHTGNSPPVNTVAQVVTGLRRNPAAWVGRTVLVRGVASRNLGPGCTIGPLWCGSIVLTDPPPARRQGVYFALTVGRDNALLGFVRRVPVVGAILPGLRRVSWGQPATYRVQFQAVPRLSCTAAPCVAVTLLDAARRSALAPPAGLVGWVECVPLVSFHGGMVTCYRPVHLAAAERRLPVRPVNPVAAVRRVLHIGLTQALVLSGMGSAAPGPAIALVYVFGTPEPACHLLRRGSCRSTYIIVQETVGHIALAGVQVTDDTRGVPGPWHLDANIPGRNLSLSIDSNTARRPVLAIARRFLTIQHHLKTARAAWYPHMPCTPPPGGVEEEQMKTLRRGVV